MLYLVQSHHMPSVVALNPAIPTTNQRTRSELVQRLVNSTSTYPSWSIFRRALEQARTVHIAVTMEPFLSALLEQQIARDCRLTTTLTAPFRNVGAGDLVLLKLARGPIVGSYTVGTTDFMRIDLRDTAAIERVRDAGFGGAQLDTHQLTGQGGRYVSAFEVLDVRKLRPVRISLANRLTWIVLQTAGVQSDSGQLTLDQMTDPQ